MLSVPRTSAPRRLAKHRTHHAIEQHHQQDHHPYNFTNTISPTAPIKLVCSGHVAASVCRCYMHVYVSPYMHALILSPPLSVCACMPETETAGHTCSQTGPIFSLFEIKHKLGETVLSGRTRSPISVHTAEWQQGALRMALCIGSPAAL